MAKTRNSHNQIVKRAGHTEKYDERKLYASMYSSLLAVRETDEAAELIAARVTEEMSGWLEKKHEVTSHDIHQHAAHHLMRYHPDAGWIYKHHKNIS